MITGHDFVQLSNRWSALAQPSGNEAVWRTAICRAYYGSFHLAQDFLRSMSVQLPKSGDGKAHWFVEHALKQSGHGGVIKAGGLLGDLRDSRNDADYDLAVSSHGAQSLAIDCHETATRIVSLINTCGAADRPAIEAKIKKWQRDTLKSRH
jgi:hypothetical protein